ncbi:hypothetical protein LS81_007510 [Helicobacter trogontum]|uniref:Uncharacterized protein n=2 Tax=Helicobacter trogontum TaxID=50960 RepID=A0A4U8S9A1_9HELI|nr:hypothetical protein LS81_007510 [Helicobacter trogontum]
MESLMQILLIPIFLLLCFVTFWLLRFWVGLFVPDDKNMSVLKKIAYTIFGILFFILSPPITFTNITILLCSCVIVMLIMKYIAPMLYTKTILFTKKHSNDVFVLLVCLLLFALIACLLNGKIQ